jgi:hypothetical protein
MDLEQFCGVAEHETRGGDNAQAREGGMQALIALIHKGQFHALTRGRLDGLGEASDLSAAIGCGGCDVQSEQNSN